MLYLPKPTLTMTKKTDEDRTLITEREFEIADRKVDIFAFVRIHQLSKTACRHIVNLGVGESLTINNRTLTRTK